MLFSCLIDEIKEISNEGLLIKNLEGGEFIINLNFYGFIGDTPAKSLVLSMIQHNGYYGCPYCFNPGTLSIIDHYFKIFSNLNPKLKGVESRRTRKYYMGQEISKSEPMKVSLSLL